jgi:hypothetical protein
MLEESFYEAIKRELVNGTVKKAAPVSVFYTGNHAQRDSASTYSSLEKAITRF